MALVTTSAVVLRTYPYSETSKIVRLATRDLGVQSAIAKGVLRPRSRFAAGLELLSEGMAQLYHRETRELQTLAAFDLLVLWRALGQDLRRFPGATGPAELMVKIAPGAPLPGAYDAAPTGAPAPRPARPPPPPPPPPPPAAAPRRLLARFARPPFGEASPPPPLDSWKRHAWPPPPPPPSAIPPPAPAPAPSAAS